MFGKTLGATLELRKSTIKTVLFMNCDILDPKTEERPVYFEFKKCDFVTHAATMANLDYDPFPNKELDDFVRREEVCKKLVLTFKMKPSQSSSVQTGNTIYYEGHPFVITKILPVQGNSGSDPIGVEGECFLEPCEPMKILAQLRQEYSRAPSSTVAPT